MFIVDELLQDQQENESETGLSAEKETGKIFGLRLHSPRQPNRSARRHAHTIAQRATRVYNYGVVRS